MATNLEKAKIMLVLARRKGNWGEKYDRLEHFKRFQNLKILRKRIFKPSDVKSLCLKIDQFIYKYGCKKQRCREIY